MLCMSELQKPAPFDPYMRAWDAYEHGGPAELAEREAVVYLHVADPTVAEDVAAAHDGLEPADLRWMVIADAFPVARGHLNVVGGRQVAYMDATDPEQAVMGIITNRVQRCIAQVLRPAHGFFVGQFGQQVPTMHTHIVPRRESADALDWAQKRSKAPLAERQAAMAELWLPNTSLDAQIDRAVTATLLRFAGMDDTERL